MPDPNFALVIGFAFKGPHKRMEQPQGGLHYRGAVHQSFASRITVDMEPPVIRYPLYPLLTLHARGLRVITFRDRFGHLAQVPSGGATEIYAAWHDEDGRAVLAPEEF